jgi:hypothetical protein
MRIEKTILSNLIHNEEFCRKVVPFLKTEYFSDRKEAVIVSELIKFFIDYNKPATTEILAIEIGNRTDLNDKDIPELEVYINDLTSKETNVDWLLGETEKFCRDKAVYNAILHSIKIIDGGDKVVQLKPQEQAESRAQAGKTRTRDAERSANSPDISGEGRNAQGDGRQVN